MAHRMSARHGPGSHACGSDISNGELGIAIPNSTCACFGVYLRLFGERVCARMPRPETADPDSYTLTRERVQVNRAGV